MEEYKSKQKEAMDLKYLIALKDIVIKEKGKLSVKWFESEFKLKILINDFEWYSSDYVDTFEDAYLMFMEDWLDYSK